MILNIYIHCIYIYYSYGKWMNMVQLWMIYLYFSIKKMVISPSFLFGSPVHLALVLGERPRYPRGARGGALGCFIWDFMALYIYIYYIYIYIIMGI